MFGKIFESLYIKVFVNIVISDTKTIIYIENIAKKRVISKIEKVFEVTSFNKDIQRFISNYIDETPYFYISILNNASEQGAMPTCLKSKYFYYEDVSDSKIVCISKKWSTFTSKKELSSLETKYKKIGVDFLFSPFIILTTFFKKEIIKDVALYIMLEEKKISLTIFRNSELLYANYLNVEDSVEEENLLTYDVDLDDGIDLEDVDAMEHIDMFDDFADIEDLDDLDDIDEFSDAKDIDDNFASLESEPTIGVPVTQEDTFSVDYQRFSLIQNAVNYFYNDEKYESIFLENIYIADSTGVGAGLSQYLEEEMFLTVHFRILNIGIILSKLAQEELK